MRKLVPFVLDALLVVVFCAIGRRSHDEAVLAGLLRTVWPFATGLVVGWLVVALRGRAAAGDARFDITALWPSGVVIWACTLVGGMLLRVVSGQGTAVSFVLVAGVVLAVFLLGWRAVYKAVR
ncbi:DUF3054 domain-containing protein [Nocardia sp. CDC186]|uniref:DUF3054 domain-containing protein n=1 Tax=Nocardia implantans TaxID=3108168 RepID=A0ABU6AMT5_9NOCA|nr:MULTISPECIES: DUF3054 domain-containing protein [unclassified Nocardia]MBF6193544.1 DUF3054 domain-containing protein [Nocardia beijingensis]MEA3532152.1 DUF3054 domain-containing protein [Nocardia sp. CDC192]MEB3508643.1 DUF3054 domain-containing protein [Nocardia sp. CDC186]